jgi:acetyl-CoA synthetase
MLTSSEDAWYPGERHLQNANVNELIKLFKVRNFDELYSLSIDKPSRYWFGFMESVGFKWKQHPSAYIDIRRGKEFPSWFPGGELNWVDNILKWSDDSQVSSKMAVVAEDESGATTSITYGQLAEAVRRAAAGLSSCGIAAGDRVGLLCENGVEATVSLLAIAYIGAIAVPLFSGFASDAIVSRLLDSGARAIVATTGFHRRGALVNLVPTIRNALTQLPAVKVVIWKGSNIAPPPPGELCWAQLAQAPGRLADSVSLSPDSPFLIMYTSGTTGKPKGIVHTHGGFPLKVMSDALVHLDIGAGDVFFWPADMGWVAGPISLCLALLRGATLVCYSGAPDSPNWSRMSKIIERHKVTHFAAVPTLIRGLAAGVPTSLEGTRASLRILMTTGEPIDLEHFHWFQKTFANPDVPVLNTTGGTEVSSTLLSSVIVKPIKPASFNTGSPAIVIGVVDARGNSVSDELGELAVKEPFVGMTASFWNDDQRYLDTYWNTIPGIWLHGDLARKSNDGSYELIGRSDDTLKIAGRRLGPAEIEEIVLSNPAVIETAAIGVKDHKKGQKLIIFVVIRPDVVIESDLLTNNLRSAVVNRLGKAFRPDEVYFVNQLPKTRTSKVLRRLIKQICEDVTLGDQSSLDNPSSLKDVREAVFGKTDLKT